MLGKVLERDFGSCHRLMAACAPQLSECAPYELAGIFAVSVIANHDNEAPFKCPRNDTPRNIVDLEQELRDLNQDVRRCNLVQVDEHPVLDHMLALDRLVEETQVFEGQIRDLDLSQNAVVGEGK